MGAELKPIAAKGTLVDTYDCGAWPPYAADEVIQRCCLGCGKVYRGTLACPACGEPGEPLAQKGRKRKQEGKTRSHPVRLSEARKERYEALARLEGCEIAEVMRRATDERCDRMLR